MDQNPKPGASSFCLYAPAFTPGVIGLLLLKVQLCIAEMVTDSGFELSFERDFV